MAILLAAAIGYILYLVYSNPVKGYKELYSQGKYKLFVKDTGNSKPKTSAQFNGGERVPFEEGIKKIRHYRDNCGENDTRYLNFHFDRIFDYMGIVLTEFKPQHGQEGLLGIGVYLGREEPEEGTEDLGKLTVLFGPTIEDKIIMKDDKDGFDFFNQGSICPHTCPPGSDVIEPEPASMKRTSNHKDSLTK